MRESWIEQQKVEIYYNISLVRKSSSSFAFIRLEKEQGFKAICTVIAVMLTLIFRRIQHYRRYCIVNLHWPFEMCLLLVLVCSVIAAIVNLFHVVQQRLFVWVVLLADVHFLPLLELLTQSPTFFTCPIPAVFLLSSQFLLLS